MASEFMVMSFGEEYASRMDDFEKEINHLDEKYPGVLERDDSFIKHIFIKHPSKNSKGHINIINGDVLPETITSEIWSIIGKYFADENISIHSKW